MTNTAQPKILIVEDNDVIARLWAITLKAHQFNVFIGRTGREALKQAKTEKPDVILLDLLMPDMDGFEIFGELKKDHATSAIPILVLSNLSAPEDREQAQRLGAVDYVVKSMITPEALAEKVREILTKDKKETA